MLKKLRRAETLGLYLYYTDDREEFESTRLKGIPVILWKPLFGGQDEEEEEAALRWLLYPILKRRFPTVDFFEMWGRPCYIDPTSWTRYGEELSSGGDFYECSGGRVTNVTESIIQEHGWKIDAEQLAQLKLMPSFLGDIASVIRSNLVNLQWEQGWNKKLKTTVFGNWTERAEAKNLIIIDVSNSIPDGISDAMIALADTLRNQCNADLIITGAKTYRWILGEELPSPQEIRELIPKCNESIMYWQIIDDYYAGTQLGTVIVFGDNDKPYGCWSLKNRYDYYHDADFRPLFKWDGLSDHDSRHVLERMRGTSVEKLQLYYVMQRGRSAEKNCPGYAAPFLPFAKEISIDTSWCMYIEG